MDFESKLKEKMPPMAEEDEEDTGEDGGDYSGAATRLMSILDVPEAKRKAAMAALKDFVMECMS